ncbi:amino acid adenylation, partial [Basidiobolus meristosporus CBS 931.73]
MSSSVNACLFPQLSGYEAGDTKERYTSFNIVESKIASVSRLYAHNTLKKTSEVERMLLHAAWTILLSTYTGNRNIAFGTYSAEGKKQLSPEVFWSMFDADERSFSAAEWIHPDQLVPSSAGYDDELFNTAIIFANGGLNTEIVDTSKLVIHGIGWLEDEDLTIQLTFAKTHFTLDQGQLIASQLTHIVRSLVENLDTPVGSLEWASPAERSLFLETWQRGKADFVKELDDSCIHQLVEKQVEKTPENIALQFEDKEWITYAELNRRSNQLAHYLIRLGAGPETIIPICLEKSILMVVAILGVLKAGAAYVPLDPEHPEERVSFIVSETKARISLTTSDLGGILSECPNLQVILLDAMVTELDQNPVINPIVPEMRSSNLCYLIFTSGSTGMPKGVMIEHRAAVNYIVAHQSILNLQESDRFLQFSNYTFDASILDFFVNLTVGSCICLATKNNLLTHLSEMARLMKVTAAQLTTTVAGLLKPKEVPTLRLLQQGGEMMTKPVRDAWAGEVDLNNGYGPTETTVYTVVRRSLSASTAYNNIGWPIGRNQVFILDDRLKLVPLGAIGELCFGGPQLARGYLNRSDLTQLAFVESPFAKGERLYRSGDLGRFNTDGSITILGRKDNQVKLNGLRIELDEVEYALHQYSEVARASVRLLSTKSTSKAGQRALVTFVAFKSTLNDVASVQVIDSHQNAELIPKIEALQSIVRQKLPKYMVPTVWVPLTRVPVNTSGKTDLRTLERIFNESNLDQLRSLGTELNKSNAKSKPNTRIEQILLSAWASVLNIDPSRIGTDDSFYHLGGDSISAIQVSSMCRQLGVKVSVQSILQHPTIHQLNNFAELITIESEGYEVVDGGDFDEDEIPLTPIQEQFFAVEQPNVNHFHLSWLVKVKTPISSGNLQTALYKLIDHHDMLRVRFSQVDSRWKQRILPTKDIGIDVKRYHVLDPEELQEKISLLQKSLDIEVGPIFAFALYDLSDGQQLLFMTIHHYIIDLVSWRIIWEDLENLLEGQPLPYKSLSFRTWSRMLRAHASTLSQSDWPSQEYIEPLNIDGSKTQLNTQATVDTLSFSLDEEYTTLLFGTSNAAYKTKAVDFMLASLAASYCVTFQTQSLGIATEGHGREPWTDLIDISRTVGWFTSIYPMNIVAGSNESIIDVLKRTKDLRQRIPNHGINYGLLRYLNEVTSREFERDSLQVGFNYLGRFQHLEKANALLQDVDDQYKFDLQMIGPQWRRMNAIEAEVTMLHNTLRASISYSQALHEKSIIERWMKAWREMLLEAITTCANQDVSRFTVSDLPLLSMPANDLDQLIDEILPKYGVRNTEDIYPCSPIQEGLIMGNMRSPSLYHVQDVYELVGSWDFEKLKSAWRAVIQDLPILRTIFINNPYIHQDSGAYLQVVLKKMEPDMGYLPVQAEDVDHVLSEYLTDDIAKGFPLGKSNIRFCLIHQNNGGALLVISRHHAINDGWSDRITMECLLSAYNNTLKPATIPFRDYIEYHIEEQRQQKSQLERDFWCNYLMNTEPCVFPKLGDAGHLAEEYVQLSVNSELRAGDLQHLAKKAGVTTFTLFQAAWGLILQPYYGADECIFGILVNGRNIPMKNVDKVVGPCINTLPLRVSYKPQAIVYDWLRKIHDHMVASIPYQHAGLHSIKKWSNAEGGALAFDSILNFQPSEMTNEATSTKGELSLKRLRIIEPTEYPLGLNICVRNEKFVYRLDYNVQTLHQTLAELFLQRLDVILDAMLNISPISTLESIPKMPNLEKDMLESFSRSNSSPFEPEAYLHSYVEWQAMSSSDRIALQTEENELVSYGELNKRANRLANYLINIGVTPKPLIPICIGKSVDMIVAILAVLKSGGAYIPLDPENPKERNMFIIEEVKAQVVITTSVLRTRFEGCARVLMDTDAYAIGQHPNENPMMENLSPSDPCYVLYTSGSTGVPKGVVLEHRSVVNFVHAYQEDWRLDTQDRVLQFANYTFDVSILEIFTTFLAGARVVIAKKESLMNNLENTINTMNITAAVMITTIAGTVKPARVPSIKKLIVGGEMLTSTVRDIWASKVILSNAYGPTEAAVAFIVNSVVDPVPLGAVGELCVSGPQLARGYLNRPDLTAAAFVSNPNSPAERMYRTGDLARFNMDGTVELIGRMDNQIKLNGLRIELDEIEHDSSRTPNDKATDRKILVALANFNEQLNEDSTTILYDANEARQFAKWIEELRTTLAAKLPPYMQPNVIIPIRQVPINTNGKVDRGELKKKLYNMDRGELFTQGKSGNDTPFLPATNTELHWLKLWSRVLGIAENQIRADSSFFSLGGDSIVAIKLVEVARQKGYILTVQQVFEHPTITEMAKLVPSPVSNGVRAKEIEKFSLLKLKPDEVKCLLNSEVQDNGIPIANVVDVYPCAPLQEGLFAIGLRANSEYLTQQVFSFDESVDIMRLKKAWSTVIKSNPILRTTIVFVSRGNSHLNGLQVVLSDDMIDWREIATGSATLMEHEIQETLQKDREEGIAEDLVRAYRALDLPQRPSYASFIEYNVGLDRGKSLEYWSRVLDGAAATHISKHTSFSTKPQARSCIEERVQVDITELARRHNITIATVMNLAWSLVLRAHTGSSDIVFGVVNSGRNVPVGGVDQICGPCINTLPVRVSLEDDSTLLDVLSQIHTAQLEQCQYQNIGLHEIQKLWGNGQMDSLFDTLLVVQNLTGGDQHHTFESIGLMEVKAAMPASYPLVVELSTGKREHHLSMLYDEDVVSQDEAKWIFEHLKTALQRIVSNTNTLIGSFSVIAAHEHELLQQWSGPSADVTHHGCIHTLFEEQVVRTPNNIAVQFEDSEFVTYHELNSRANRLAHYLAEIGVGVESMVPLCIDRSIDMVVAILAVLKLEEPTCYTSRFQGSVPAVVAIEDLELEEYSDTNPVIANLTGANLCYVIYTSGSTGVPKGVLLEHTATLNFVVAMQDVWRLEMVDSVLQFASYTFDAFVIEVFVPLLFGSRTCLANKEALYSKLDEMIAIMNVNTLMLTPSVASLLQCDKNCHVKRLCLGGEMMTPDLKDRWASLAHLSNAYGPTESAVAFMVNRRVTESTSCGNIGLPFGRNRIYILDSRLRPVPLGAVGELCVSGPQLARGYLNRPDLTAAAFVSNPNSPAERMYRTGDLARFNMDGTVELIGRMDNQIKLNGLRIELDEIEHVLHEHPMVSRACVLPLAVDKATDRKTLVAFLEFTSLLHKKAESALLYQEYVEPVRNILVQVEALVRFKLPSYMVPCIWFPLGVMPKNSSGKIARGSLMDLYQSTAKEEIHKFNSFKCAADPQSKNENESIWVTLWSQALNIDEDGIDISDTFFSLGGDSIVAIKLVAAARRQGYQITVQQVFEHPTITEMAKLVPFPVSNGVRAKEIEKFSLLKLEPGEVEDLLNVDVQNNGIPISSVEDVYPCVPLQEGLFALGLRANSEYLTQHVFSFDESVDIMRLKKAWSTVIKSNPILRTTIVFVSRGNSHLNGLQVVLSDDMIDWREIATGSATLMEHEIQETLQKDREEGIAEDLVRAYRALDLPQRPSYASFIEYNVGLDRGKSLEYWSRVLDGAAATHISKHTSFSTKPQARSCIEERVQVDITELARRHNITIATVMNLAWSLVLRAHTGSSDVVFGVVNSGRNVPCQYQNIGLHEIQKLWGNGQMDSLFDTLLVVQNLTGGDQRHTFESIGLMEVKAAMPASYPLVVELSTGKREHHLSMLYDEDVVSQDEAKWIFEHLKTALQRIVSNTNTLVGSFSVIAAHEHELLQQWSGPSTDVTHHGCIHTLFEEQVVRTPNNIAVQFEDSEFVTYHELNSRANRLAHYLAEIGVGVESMVPLCIDRSIDMVVAILAVLKAGGAYVPMDPANPEERSRFIVKETSAQTVLVSRCYTSRFQGSVPAVVVIEDLELEEYSDTNPVIANLTGANLCYVIYTSGSTGVPKGVLLEHTATLNFVVAMQDVWRLEMVDSVLQFASYTFDAFVIEVFVPLLFGSRTCLANKEALYSKLDEMIAVMNVNTLMLTPSVASLLQCDKNCHVKRLCLGGEMMTPDLKDRWASLAHLSNAYGPTESAVAFMVNRRVTESTSCGNIGLPFGRNRIYILDSRLRPVPLGAVGELCVSGPQLARGYLNRPDLTAAAFVSNPDSPAERMYRTGDLARFNMDGTVELIGRMDNQIKLNGLRIELDEIEHILHEHPMVSRACVLPLIVDKETNRKILVALVNFYEQLTERVGTMLYNAAETEQFMTWIAEIQTLLTTKLPSYMEPNMIIPIRRVPTNELHALSKSEGETSSLPATEMELCWIKLWSRVLIIAESQIRTNSSFFSLGGDSIVAIKLVAAARQQGYQITVQQVFEHPTITEMAKLVPSPVSNGVRAKEIEKFSLLKLEPGLFALGLRANSEYLTQHVFSFDESVDIMRLKKAWSTVIKSNPILRTTIVFVSRGNSHLNGLQVVLSDDMIDWREIATGSATLMEHEIQETLQKDREEGIAEGKLLTRFTWLRGEQPGGCLIWTIHHALYDGWSMGLIVEDLVRAYRALDLPQRPSYASFIEYNVGLDRGKSLEYWSRVLDGAAATHISKHTSFSTKPQTRSCIEERVQVDITELARRHNITIATVMNLAWSLVLRAHTGSSDVVFGVVNSGRNVPVGGIDQICGPCINTLPVRVNLEDDSTLLDVLSQIHTAQLEQCQYQNIGLQEIQKLWGNGQMDSLFDTLLVVQNLTGGDQRHTFESIGLMEVKAAMPASYPLVVELSTGKREHHLSMLYDEDVVSQDEAKWIFEHLKTALQRIASNTNTLIGSFSVIAAHEHELLQQWSGPSADVTHHGCIHTLFEEQVVRTPNNIAVQFEDSEFVTYHELNSRANRLAHYLAEIGVGVESMVPLCIDKSVDMIVAMLAVLKAGGAYVPMDPNYPEARSSFIISETHAIVVVTSSKYMAKFDKSMSGIIDCEDKLLENYSEE